MVSGGDMLDLRPVKEEAVSPADFLALKPSEKENIEHARVHPPRLGEDGFGTIVLRYRVPVYKVLSKYKRGK